MPILQQPALQSPLGRIWPENKGDFFLGGSVDDMMGRLGENEVERQQTEWLER
jgi:hypothetical protein